MFQPPLAAKRQGEVILVPFDFFDQMVFGETLSVPVVTVSLFSGLDLSPSAILSGVATVSGSIVTQKVQAGMTGVTYVLTCAATGSSGNSYRVSQLLAVVSITGFAPSSIPVLSGSLPDGMVGVPYSANLTISGGYMPYEPVGLIAGAPAWMGFTVTDDILTCHGLPDEPIATNYVFSPTILDAALTPASSPQDIDISRVTISGDAPDGTIGAAYSYTYTFGNGTPPYSFAITAGSVFTGTMLNPATSEIAGTTTTEEVKTWTIEVTDANGVTASLNDGGEVRASDVYIFIDNNMLLLRSVNSGASFTETIDKGAMTPTSTLSLSSAGGILYALGGSNQGKYSASGNSGTFNFLTGTLPFSVGAGMMYKFGSEWQLYTGQLFVSNDGVNFNQRVITGGTANTVANPVSDGAGNILAIGSGHRLMISNNGGMNFSEYTNAEFNTFSGIQFLLYIPGVGYKSFGRDPAGLQIIGSSATGAAASWSYINSPEQAALTANIHGVARNPTTGRVVMILRNGHTWFSDDNCATWNAGPNFTYGAPLDFRFINATLYSNGYYYFCYPQGGGVNIVQRIPEDMSAWTVIYSNTGGNGIDAICAHP